MINNAASGKESGKRGVAYRGVLFSYRFFTERTMDFIYVNIY